MSGGLSRFVVLRRSEMDARFAEMKARFAEMRISLNLAIPVQIHGNIVKASQISHTVVDFRRSVPWVANFSAVAQVSKPVSKPAVSPTSPPSPLASAWSAERRRMLKATEFATPAGLETCAASVRFELQMPRNIVAAEMRRMKDTLTR
jgi:hypothetical protein